MNKIQKDLKLLPNYFKKITLGLMALSIILWVLSHSKIMSFDKDLIKIIALNGLLISLLLLAMTKDKIEDELTLKIRLKALAGSFIFGVALVIVDPYVNFLFEGNFISIKGTTELLLFMFFFYFLTFYSLKKKR